MKKFQKKWKSRTDCRKTYVVQTCNNAPKQSTTSTPGAVPQQGGAQQGGAQQVPQQGGAQQAPQQVPGQP